MKPLKLIGRTNATEEMVAANLDAALAMGYKTLQIGGKSGQVSIVGAGPSLAATYRDLVGDVIACNSAHDYLIDRGIVPTYAMLWDANPVMAEMVKPHHGVKYLIASRCHPSVFDRLRGYNVTVWHALGDDALAEKIKGRLEPVIAGGSSSVLRATHVASAMGYTEMHLFGVDSCYSADATHVSGSLVAQDRMQMEVCGRRFYVAGWMAVQAEEFKLLAPILKACGVRLTVHGTGLIPYLATFLGVDTPDVKVSLYEHARRFVQSVFLMYLSLTKPQLLGASNAGN